MEVVERRTILKRREKSPKEEYYKEKHERIKAEELGNILTKQIVPFQ